MTATGNITTTANVTASSGAGLGFFGNGRNVTALSATNVDTGTLNNARLPTNVNIGGTLNANGTTFVVDVSLGGNITVAGQPTLGASTGDGATYTVYNNFVGSWFGLAVRCAFDSTVRHVFNTRNGNLDMTGTCTAAAFSGAGSALTTLSATNVSSGTLNNARLPTNVNVAGTLNANGATTLATATMSGNVNAAQLAVSGISYIGGALTAAAGTTTNVTGNLTATGNITTTANVTASSGAGLGFFGNGRNITALSATNVDTGTLNNARLPTNHDVAGTLNANGAATFNATVNVQTPAFVGSNNPTFIETGYGQTKETNAGVIGYRRFTSDALDIIGATPDGVVASGDRRIWMTDKVAMGGSNALGTNDTVKIHGNLTVANTATAAAFSGPSLTAAAATALVLGAGGSERVRIDANGNVGIGNSAPAHTLAVNGTAYVSGVTTVGGDVLLNNSGTGYITRTVAAGLNVNFLRSGGGNLHTVTFTSNTTQCLLNDGSPAHFTVSGNATVSGALIRGVPVTKTTSFTLAATESYVICNGAGTIVVTLPAASATAGRDVTIKTIAAQTVTSAASDVYPLAGGALGTAILLGTAGKYARLVSNSSGWVIMEAN